MKQNIVLFCKSYSKDMLRARRMAESIQCFNADNIPFYVSVPSTDLNNFQKCFGDIPAYFLTDEQILSNTCNIYGPLPKDFPTDLLQQLVKLEFWRMGLCENYLWLDSDSYFIKTFHRENFFHAETTPYTVQHLAQDLLGFAARTKNKKITRDFNNMAVKFQKLFHRSGPLYDFGCSPLLWSCRVLESLADDYLKPDNKTIYTLLQEYPSEMQLYGEYLLFSKKIPIVPTGPFFKVYHYAEQFFEAQMQGESELSLAKKYLGVVVQANWAKLAEKKKPPLTRLKRFFGKIGEQVKRGVRSIMEKTGQV
jgi:hypothetical protein